MGPYIIMNNVLDAAVNYTMTESSSAALIESLRAQHPDIMAQLPNIRLVEQGSLDDGTQPYTYLCDTVVEHNLSIDLTGRLQPSAGSQWNAMSDLIDVLAPGARLGWYVIHNDDPFRGGNPPVPYKDTEQVRSCYLIALNVRLLFARRVLGAVTRVGRKEGSRDFLVERKQGSLDHC